MVIIRNASTYVVFKRAIEFGKVRTGFSMLQKEFGIKHLANHNTIPQMEKDSEIGIVDALRWLYSTYGIAGCVRFFFNPATLCDLKPTILKP